MQKQIKLNDIVTMPLSKLIPHPRNPRKISESKIAMLKKSMEHFGDVNIITYNQRTRHVIGGNQRIKVMQALGWKEADVRVVDLPENEEVALMARLNVADGEFIMPVLKEILFDLDAQNFDLDLTGFDIEEFEKLATNAPPILEEEKKKCPKCGYDLSKK